VANHEETGLLRRAKRGDRSALEELLRDLEPRLFRVARFLAGNREEARDLVQETMLALCLRLGAFRGEAKLYTYAYRILVNTFRKRLRKRHLTVPPADYLPYLGRRVASSGAAPDPEAAGVRLRAGLARLPERYRQVIVSHYLEEAPLVEIARRLGIPEGTVKSRLYKARRLLADRLRKE